MTFTIASYWIPISITVIGVYWALCVVSDRGGYMSDLGNLLALIPVSIVSAIAWIIRAIFK